MPNHVDSDLSVTGPAEDVAAFKAFAQGEEDDDLLSADKFIPYPEKFKKLDQTIRDWGKKANEWAISCGHTHYHQVPREEALEYVNANPRPEKDGFNSGGYEWCCEYWGTKWGIYDVTIADEQDGYILYNFNTAWSAPNPIIIAMSAKFPTLSFKMWSYEGGMGWKQELYVEGGEVVYEDCSDYDDDPEERRGG